MGTYRIPGPLCAETQAIGVSDGTSCPWASSAPGPVNGAGRGWAHEHDPRTIWRRLRTVHEALAMSEVLVHGAVWRETACDVGHLVDDLWPALRLALGVLGVTAVLGGVIGAAFGALAGGFGAVPGGAAGVLAGADLGLAVLGWLGLAMLVEPAAHSLGELSATLRSATVTAWEAYGRPDSDSQLRLAAAGYAQSVAILMRLVLMGIVARLSARPALAVTTRAAASLTRASEAGATGESVASLVASLRQTRLGRPFADWVEGHSQELLNNPRLRAQAATTPAASGSSSATTPSQMRRGSAPPPAAEDVSIAKQSTARKGVFGEHHADTWMDRHDMEKLNGPLTQLDDAPQGTGIDGVWRNPVPPPEFVVTEAKYGASDLGSLTDGTRQMSDKWIDARLDKAVGPDLADEIRDADARGQVQKWLLQVDQNGAVRRSLLTESAPNSIVRTPLPDGFP